MKTFKTVIIDDERLAREEVKRALKGYPEFEIIGEASHVDEAKILIEESKPDLLFLDIHMPGKSGFDLLEELTTVPEVVFTTAYDQYAVKAFELNALDYLVKPIPFNRFLKTINKITQQVYLQKGIQKEEDSSNESFIFLKVDKKLVKIKFEDILYVESLKDYIKVFTTSGNYLVHKSLTSITEELPDSNFIRIHRSYTIAIDKVKSVEGNLIEITTNKIPIGRKYVHHAKRIILNID